MLNRISCSLACLILVGNLAGCLTRAQQATDRQVLESPSLDELLLFFPAKYPDGEWSPKNLKFQDVDFESSDGTKLHGWYCPVENPREVVLIAHGNAGHVASRAGWLKYLQEQLRVSVFMFDYRGYGRSEGIPTVQGSIEDAIAARKKLCELAQVNDSQIVLMGESLGGAIMVQLASKSAPKAMVLQSTFSSLKDVADVHFPNLSALVPRKKLDSVGAIKSFRGPLLLSHGTRDQTIPYALGERLFQAANEPKQFVPVLGADHNDALTKGYLQKLEGFFGELTRSK
ncbi:MAG: alpha/beta hydrolase [Planctomycetota bacterium]|jgi:fermentation-respiration switch protein FrsA (DUF1100 family)